MPNLYPTNYEDKSISIDTVEKSISTTGYKPSIYYDIKNGEVARDGQNKVLTATGVEAWQQWCNNCLNTERYSCAAYSTDFGIEREKALQTSSREEAEAFLTFQITDALMADPYKRTKYVSNIDFNWVSPDGVEVTVTVYGIDDAKIDIITTISK